MSEADRLSATIQTDQEESEIFIRSQEVRDRRGGRVVVPHTTPEGYLVNLYGRAVGTVEQVPKAKRHDHLLGAKG